MDQKNNLPKYRAYTVIQKPGKKDFWHSIGAGFIHRDGLGLSVSLQALPLDGRIVLRPFTDEIAAPTPNPG